MRDVLIGFAGLCLASVMLAQSPTDARKIWNDTYTAMLAQSQAFLPNPFLTQTVDGKKPGKALDIGMGEGRNALMLAERGWNVTGFDISDIAIGRAKAQAAQRGLKLNAVVADVGDFDYGTEQYDLIAAIYVHGAVTDRADDVIRSLKHGGVLVVEGFHHDAGFFGYQSNELLRVFSARLTITHYEDAIGQPDPMWKEPGKNLRFIRLVACKE